MPTSHLSQTSNAPSIQHSRNLLDPCNKHRRCSECPAQVIRITSRRPPGLSLTRAPKSIAVAPSSCLESETIVLAARSHVRCLRFLCPHFSPPRPPVSWRRPLPGHISDAHVCVCNCLLPPRPQVNACLLRRHFLAHVLSHLCSDCCLLLTIHCRDASPHSSACLSFSPLPPAHVLRFKSHPRLTVRPRPCP